jgi:8-oxo-dGTP pyrophosphatase MutT (NUDIX family)
MTDGSEVWGFPKGHVDEGETVTEGALRELEEETGVTIDDITPYQLNFFLNYTSKTKNLFFYKVKVGKEFLDKEYFCRSIVENRNYPEIDKYLWCEISDLDKYIKNHMTKVVDKLKDLI